MLKLELEHNKIDADLHMSAQKDQMEIHKAELDHHDKLADLAIRGADVAHKNMHGMIDHALAHEDQKHRHAKEVIETVHMVNQKPKEEKSAPKEK